LTHCDGDLVIEPGDAELIARALEDWSRYIPPDLTIAGRARIAIVAGYAEAFGALADSGRVHRVRPMDGDEAARLYQLPDGRVDYDEALRAEAAFREWHPRRRGPQP
jgi:hypothetical protein